MRFFKSISLAALALSFFVACNNTPTGEKVAAEEAKDVAPAPAATEAASTYNVDVVSSIINWVGAKPTDKHVGTIALKSGALMVGKDGLEGGKFEIDLNSINCTDLEGKKKEKLEAHLKNEDFFDVANHPVATFEITEVKAVEGVEGATHNITGNLTMRGTAKSITIPAKIEMADGQFMASTPDFVIDRTQWNISYKSASLTSIVKDKAIKDEIGLTLSLKASK